MSKQKFKVGDLVYLPECTKKLYELVPSNNRMYDVEFEKPKPSPKEIIKHLLSKQKFVVCLVSNISLDKARESGYMEIITADKEGYEAFSYHYPHTTWLYAFPIDNNGNEITSIDD